LGSQEDGGLRYLFPLPVFQEPFLLSHCLPPLITYYATYANAVPLLTLALRYAHTGSYTLYLMPTGYRGWRTIHATIFK
jgi:hypothetical protein